MAGLDSGIGHGHSEIMNNHSYFYHYSKEGPNGAHEPCWRSELPASGNSVAAVYFLCYSEAAHTFPLVYHRENRPR